jgi:pyruvate formate lyase activating enzyme
MDVDGKTGRVLDIQRFSTEDGPGIRTTVFMQGCALRCKWCQNPESWEPRPRLAWYSDRCIGARHCVDACPENALTLTPEGMHIDRGACTGCGKCADACPAKALEVLGKKMSVDEVVDYVLRDRAFYEQSDGGATLSGGDPLFQPGFSKALLTRLRENNIHTALDTTGHAEQEPFAHLVSLSDLVLLDLKHMDPELHRKHTGVGLDKILANARWLGAQEREVWIRTAIIPGHTDQESDVAAIASFIKGHMLNVERWDLLCYNNLCVSKWKRLDMRFDLEDLPLVSEETIAKLAETAKASGVPVTWSGVVRKPATDN